VHRESVPPVAFFLTFGATGIANTAATRFLPQGYSTVTAGTTSLDFRIGAPCFVARIDMNARVAGGAGQTMTGVVRKNGAPTAAALATASNATTGSQTLAAPLSFLPGDTLGVEVDKSAGFASPTDLFYTLTIYI
jgi:hypothetical protein